MVSTKDRKENKYKNRLNFFFTFQLKWGDGYEGQGEQFYDYNHGPSYEEPAPYNPPPPAYAPPVPAYLPN
jgi:hypothetical protein